MNAFADPEDFGAPISVMGEPLDIKPRLRDAEDFPVDALPPRLAGAVRAIVDIVQIPAAVATQSVLAACSLLAQTRLMVELPTRELVPPTLFLMSILVSGDRKSSADKHANKAIYDFEARLHEVYAAEQNHFTIEKAAYDAALAKAKKDGGKDREKVHSAIQGCGTAPTPPPIPTLLVEDATMEGVVRLLDEAYPSIGIFSDDGAKFLGGYSMQAERSAASGAALSQLWDGKPIKRVRASDVTKILRGRRCSFHLMVQPGVAQKFFGTPELRDQGLMSRLLVTYPRSLKGERFWREPSAQSWSDLEAYQGRLGKLLHVLFNGLDPQTRELQFQVAAMQPEARALWIEFSDWLEGQQGPGGALAEVSDIASKMAEHAARLAAVVAYFEGGESVAREGISAAAMGVGIVLGRHYLTEALRLFNIGSTDEDSDNAQKLIEFVHKEKLTVLGKRWLQQNGPSCVKVAVKYNRALELLIHNGHLKEVQGKVSFTARGKDITERKGFTVIYAEETA